MSIFLLVFTSHLSDKKEYVEKIFEAFVSERKEVHLYK